MLLPVVVMFKNTGNAPPMKQKVFKLSATSPWKTVQTFLRKQLKFKDSESLVRTSTNRKLLESIAHLTAATVCEQHFPTKPR